MRVFRQKFTLEDAIGSHACLLEANMRVTNGIPVGSTALTVVTINHVETLKVGASQRYIALRGHTRGPSLPPAGDCKVRLRIKRFASKMLALPT